MEPTTAVDPTETSVDKSVRSSDMIKQHDRVTCSSEMISVAGAVCGPAEVAVVAPGSCRSIPSLRTQRLQHQKQQLQRLGASQERPRGQEAAVCVAGALQRRRNRSCSVDERPIALQERCSGQEATFAALQDVLTHLS